MGVGASYLSYLAIHAWSSWESFGERLKGGLGKILDKSSTSFQDCSSLFIDMCDMCDMYER